VKKLIIIIPARKNSKRLKNKNILTIGSLNLVERSIIFAKKLVKNNRIVLSTDSSKIQKIGKKNGILVPWLRPKSLSADTSKTTSVVLHSLKWYEKKIEKIDYILLLQPTTPFRSLIFFKKAIKMLFKNSKNNYISVNLIKKKILINKHLKFNNKILNKVKNKNYIINGSMYLISTKEFKKKNSFLTKSSIGLPISQKKFQVDIDYLKDFKKAKQYI
jgi:CMP-N,N'-diacetyllegionaminic acid synthase